MVTGKFLFNECPGGELVFHYREFPGDANVKYTMRHDTVYTIPLGVAMHLNDRCAYPEYSHNLDGGKAIAGVTVEGSTQNMYIQSKIHRTNFIPLDFTLDAGTVQFGGTVNSSLNNASLSLLKNNVLFDSVDVNGNGLALVDVPVLDATTGVETIYGNLYTPGTQPTTPSAPPVGYPIQPPLAVAPYIAKSIIAGVQAASTLPLTVVYANGLAGVGATLTNAGAQVAFAVDGYTANLNDRILIKDQASQFQNGIYTVTDVGSAITNWVLTRATDYDSITEIIPASATSVSFGTINAGKSFQEVDIVMVIGTDPIAFAPFIGVDINNFINYATGQFVITFPVAPLAGQAINSQTVPTIPSRPFAMLYHNNTITIRPVPDQPYAINFEVDARPTQLFQTNSVPQLEELWQYIALLASKKIFEDRMDMDSVQMILPELDTQERLCLRRTLVQLANQRSATIYAGVTGDSNQFNQGFGYGGTF
ncbi:unnamed protein product [Sphagnum balticum]